MEPKELMIPRWKVIAPWPGIENHNCRVGDILTDDGKTVVINQNSVAQFALKWNDYPAIFQPLQWYEERKPEDMPGYVKEPDGMVDSSYNPVISRVWKVKKHFSTNSGDWRDDSCNCFAPDDLLTTSVNYSNGVPATEQDYLTYKQ